MPRVFISYGAQDRDRASVIAEALKGEGLEVWWDGDAPFGKPTLKTIDEELEKAQQVLVLWSGRSVRSEAMPNHADYARGEQKLVSALLEPTKLPPRFSGMQSASLLDADPRRSPDWRALVAQLKGGEAAFVPGEGKRSFISFRKLGLSVISTGLTTVATVAAAAPTIAAPFERVPVVTMVAQSMSEFAPTFSALAALLVLFQMGSKVRGS
jgi:hypothetical protein